MYNLINNSIEVISQDAPLAQHFADYLWLKENYTIIDIAHNEEYKNRYANFWRMNQARLPQEYKNQYFGLLLNIRDNNLQTIIEIVDTLYAIPINGINKIQFSFATKLLHTTNNDLPIYDSLMKDFFFFSKISSNLEFETKRDRYINQYNFLIAEYSRIIENNLLLASINFIKENYQLNELVTDIKIIDSIIWSFVKYLREGNIENGNILF
ncbi:MAG: hypothetical protein KKB34_16160 [Bacteroidetes bacterium]|nr:hypothetical protein [Bacteroidota bacterium]